MFVLAGPNGAGKSTLYDTVIKPRIHAPFINADVIQRQELNDPSMQAAYKAAEIAEQRRRECMADGNDFVTESTFSHPSKLVLVEEAKAAGYRVVMCHVNVRSADISVLRVAKRYMKGGHDVPEQKIRERYERNQALIRQAVLQADRAFAYDNSTPYKPPTRAIDFVNGKVIRIAERVPAWARELYAAELRRFSPARLDPAAASIHDARAIVRRLAGEGADVHIPTQGRMTSARGEIVGETAEHWVQQIQGTASFLAHLKSAITGVVLLHRVYVIDYPERGQATATAVLPGLAAVPPERGKGRD